MAVHGKAAEPPDSRRSGAQFPPNGIPNGASWEGRLGALPPGSDRQCVFLTAQFRAESQQELSVLDCNVGALDFYRKLGALPMDEWTVYRLTGEALRELAASGDRSH